MTKHNVLSIQHEFSVFGHHVDTGPQLAKRLSIEGSNNALGPLRGYFKQICDAAMLEKHLRVVRTVIDGGTIEDQARELDKRLKLDRLARRARKMGLDIPR